MDDGRALLGARLRDARRARRWSQAELARRVGAGQSTIAKVEGGGAVRIELIDRICRALGGELRLEARLPHASEPRRQADRVHAACVGAMRRLVEGAGHICATEVEVVDGPWRGWVDVLAYDPKLRRVVVVEVKTELRDAGALERQVERYVRGVVGAARSRSWTVREVAVAVVVLATSTNDAFAVANRHLLGAAFPTRGRAAAACLLDGAPVQGRMFVMIDPRRRGRRRLMRTAADGRRTVAPYRDYADCLARWR